MLTLNQIAINTIKHTRDLVGDMLADLPNTEGGATIKAVTDIRQKGPLPNLPYITVDIDGYQEQEGWIQEAGAVEAEHPTTGVTDFYPFYDKNVEFMIIYYAYGLESQDILRTLKGKLEFSTSRERIFTDSDVRLVTTGPIVRTPDLEATDFRDAANMSTRYAAVDRFIDFGDGVIRRVTYSGRLVEADNTEQQIPDQTINVN